MKFDSKFSAILDRTNERRKTTVYLAQDIRNDSGAKRYTEVSVDSLYETDFTCNRNLYEVLVEDEPVKLYFDIELEREGITENAGLELVEEFLLWVNDIILRDYGIPVNLRDYARPLSSCRLNKISFHVILHSKICFASVNVLKGFIKRLYVEFGTQDIEFIKRLSWLYKEEQTKRYIFDSIPYGKNQNIRLINQSKKGKPFTLQELNFGNIGMDESNIFDTFIRLYHGTGDRFIVQNEPVVNSNTTTVVKVKTTKLSTTTDKMNRNPEFNPTGRTLQQKRGLTNESMKSRPLWEQFVCLIPNESQSWEIYRNVGFAIKGSGGTKSVFIEWAALSQNFDGSDPIIQAFDRFTVNSKSLKIAYLKMLAKQASPDYFEEGLPLLRQYFNPNYEGIRIVKESTKYITLQNLVQPEKILLLRAQLGGGKTTSIMGLIKQSKYNRILFISPRITFSQFISSEFGTALYLDSDVNLKSDKLTISVESLYKIKGVDSFDLIVIDECEANLSVFTSSTIKDKQVVNYNLLIDFIQKAKKVIFAGAFVTKKTINYILSLNEPAVCIYNTTIPDRKKVIRVHEDLFILKLIESVKKGEKNYVVYASLKQMNEDLSFMRGVEDPIMKAVLNNMLVYSSESDDSQLESLRNIEEYWGKVQLVMTTPSITVGNSYKPEFADFHNIFIHGSPTCIVADTFQGHKRVRETINQTLYYALPNKKSLDTGRRLITHKLKLINSFNEDNAVKRKITSNLINELIVIKSRNPIYNADADQLRQLALTFGENRVKSPKGLKDLIIFNYIEAVLSSCYYAEMFEFFLQLNNYSGNNKEFEPSSDESNDIRDLSENRIETDLKYSEIPHIDHDKLIVLKSKQAHKTATRLEKLQICRYYFDEIINPGLAVEFYCPLFDCFKNHNKRVLIFNMLDEHRENVELSLLYRSHLEEATLENMTCQPLKIALILKLNELLGIQNTCISGLSISREAIEACIPYLKTEECNINKIFGFSKMKFELFEFRETLLLIKKIYKTWSGYEFESVKDSHKKVLSVNATPFIKITTGVTIFRTEEEEVEEEFNEFSHEFSETRRLRVRVLSKIETEEDRVLENKKSILREKKKREVAAVKEIVVSNTKTVDYYQKFLDNGRKCETVKISHIK